MNDPMFDVKEVLVDSSIRFVDDRPLKALKGQNVFRIDLNRLHRQIASQYPQIAQLRIVRQFPHIIKVLAKKRDILLQVQTRGRYLIVDKEGVTMFYAGQPLPSVPLVQGVPIERHRVVLGTSPPIKELTLVVNLFGQLKSHPSTSRLRVLSVEAGNLSKVELTVMPHIRIIVDEDDLATEVNMLEVLLQNGKINWSQVQYIDVRFREPIINAS